MMQAFSLNVGVPQFRACSKDVRRCPSKGPTLAAQKPTSRAVARMTAQPVSRDETKQAAWEREYKAYIRENGRNLCWMCYEGFRNLGRGAVLTSSIDPGRESPTEAKSKVDRVEGQPTMYLTADKLREQAPIVEAKDIDQITKRMASYDPEKQFVVVFSHGGLMGADIVTPSMTPRAVWMAAKTEDEFKGPRSSNLWRP